MTAEAVLAIDQGTSATKAVVVSGVDGVIASAEVALRARYLAGGGVEQEPLALLESVLEAGRRALAQAASPVEVVAIANQGETVLAWDLNDGRPLSQAIVWQDRRAGDVCTELDAHREMLAARTGLVLDPYFSAPKMAWLRRKLTCEGVVTTTDSWLVHQLTGEFVTDVSTASRSLVMDLDRLEWDGGLLELFGLSDEPMPRLVGCDQPVGTTTAFGATMEVGGLIVDQQAALLAQACWEPGQAKCTFGTGAFLLANTGPRAVRSVTGLTASVAWRIHEHTAYCIDGQIYTAASAVRWLTELGLIGHARELDVLGGDDAEGVVCVPALAGLAAPWWRPQATATFAGMTLATRPAHLVTGRPAGHRRPGRRAHRCRPTRHRSAAQLATGRWRADPIAPADASRRRPRHSFPSGSIRRPMRPRWGQPRSVASPCTPACRSTRRCWISTRGPSTNHAGRPNAPPSSASAGAQSRPVRCRRLSADDLA